MKLRLILLATLTLIGFPLVGFGILFFFKDDPLIFLFQSHTSLVVQIGIGIITGIVLGRIAQFIISQPFLRDTEAKYARLISNFQLDHATVIFVSFCAGFGEELLFRGAMQPLIGIWPTAILFIALHGYLNPKNWRISVYGLFMTVAIASLGYLTKHIGIWSACLAHMFIDYVLFQHLIKYRPKVHYLQKL